MTREDRIAKAIDEALPLYRPVMRKAYAGIAPPRSAIKAQCLQCVGYERLMVTHCTGYSCPLTGYSCPLWAYRPYQIRGGMP